MKVFLTLLLFVVVPNSFANGYIDESIQPVQIVPDIGITDYWFFVGPLNDQKKASYKRSKVSIVYKQQCFGFRVFFQTLKKKVKLKITLQVPNSVERFPSHTGRVTISQDRKKITVEDEIDGPSYAHYWGVSNDDPIGKYELKFWLQDILVDAYTFTVE